MPKKNRRPGREETGASTGFLTAPGEIASALSEAVRAALARGEEAHVPGLGTFRIRHEPSRIEETPDQRLVLAPPADRVTFEPEPGFSPSRSSPE